VFTSEFDRVFAPGSSRDANPYDWDGIYISNEGFGTRMANCHIDYSVYGLVSETKFIRLEAIRFRNNGKKTVVVDQDELETADAPFEYVLAAQDAMVDGIPVDILKDPLGVRRTAFRYIGLTAFIGGCAAGVYQINQIIIAQKDLEEIQNKTQYELAMVAQALSATDREPLEAYLADKYAVTLER
jgi:hypothetical protein